MRALGLETPFPDVAGVLTHLGFIQIDPINICGRMHDLILRNRIAGYQQGDLHRHLHSTARPGFEHYLPGAGILCAFPIDAWPYLAGFIRSRGLRRGASTRRLSPKNELLAQHILSEIARRGPLTSDDIEHDGRSLTAWGTPGRHAKNLLEALFVQGRVLITARRNFRRVYDLPERVLPPAALSVPPPAPAALARWSALARLRQRRLVTLKRAEQALVADAVQRVQVPDCPPLFCLREDVPQLVAADSDLSTLNSPLSTPPNSQLSTPPTLLAPLDPLIYDRRVAAALWDFDYTWEVYTPAHKRVRGYYALPVLAGTEIVGHVDPKADGAQHRLVVVGRRIRRGHRAAPAVRDFARWLGLKP